MLLPSARAAADNPAYREEGLGAASLGQPSLPHRPLHMSHTHCSRFNTLSPAEALHAAKRCATEPVGCTGFLPEAAAVGTAFSARCFFAASVAWPELLCAKVTLHNAAKSKLAGRKRMVLFSKHSSLIFGVILHAHALLPPAVIHAVALFLWWSLAMHR